MSWFSAEKLWTGYHVAPWHTWNERIWREGLVPQLCRTPNIRENLASVGVSEVIWLWDKAPTGIGLLGTVVDRMISHGDTRLVVLKAHARQCELFRPPVGRWTFSHSGVLEHWQRPEGFHWHKDEPFHLAVKPIPPKRLELLADIDLLALCEQQYVAAALPSYKPEKSRATMAAAPFVAGICLG